MAGKRSHPGLRLREFREARKISLREAARQLHVAHPALKDWETNQVPTPPYREAIERWTNGAIKASDWPLSPREREIVANARQVGPVREPESGPSLDPDASDEFPSVDMSTARAAGE